MASGKLLNLSGSWILSVIVSASTGGYEVELGCETELQTVCHFRGAGGRPGWGGGRDHSQRRERAQGMTVGLGARAA